MDATQGNSFGGVTPNSTTTPLSTLYGVEDRIIDGLDVAGAGLVRIVAGNVYVANSSENLSLGGSAGSIQRAVDLANSGDSIYVQGGTTVYTGSVVIDKANIKLLGAAAGFAGSNGGDRPTESVIDPGSSDPGATLVDLQASGITVEGFTIDGANPNLSTGDGVVLADGTYAQYGYGIGNAYRTRWG